MKNSDSPSWSKPLLLSLFLFVLSLVAYWAVYRHKPDQERNKEKNRKVFQLEGSQIKKIVFKTSATPLTFSCLSLKDRLCSPGANAQWEITQPKRYSTDHSAMNALLSSLDSWISTSSFELPQDATEKKALLLKEFEINIDSEKPSSTHPIIQLETEAQTLTARVGRAHPFESARYIYSDQSPNRIYILPDHFLTVLENPVGHWRNKKLLNLSQSSVQGIKIFGGAHPSIHLIRHPSFGWKIQQQNKEATPADTDRVNAWLSGVLFLNAKEISDSKLSPNFKKNLTIDLITEEGKKTSIHFYSKFFRDGKKTASQLYAKVSDLDPLFEMDTTTLSRLDVKEDQFHINRLLFAHERIQTQWIRIGSTEWTKKGEEWKITSGSSALSPEAFLDRISSPVLKQATKKTTLNPPPESSLSIQLGTSPQEVTKNWKFWKKDGKVFVQAQGDKIYETEEDLWGLISEKK